MKELLVRVGCIVWLVGCSAGGSTVKGASVGEGESCEHALCRAPAACIDDSVDGTPAKVCRIPCDATRKCPSRMDCTASNGSLSTFCIPTEKNFLH